MTCDHSDSYETRDLVGNTTRHCRSCMATAFMSYGNNGFCWIWSRTYDVRSEFLGFSVCEDCLNTFSKMKEDGIIFYEGSHSEECSAMRDIGKVEMRDIEKINRIKELEEDLEKLREAYCMLLERYHVLTETKL